jgi:hypothetical protein
VTPAQWANFTFIQGDIRDLPKIEDRIGNPLSPYAVTKYVNELYALIKDCVHSIHPETPIAPPVYRDFRKGDVWHSLADITRARKHQDYNPQWTVAQVLHPATRWYAKQHQT